MNKLKGLYGTLSPAFKICYLFLLLKKHMILSFKLSSRFCLSFLFVSLFDFGFVFWVWTKISKQLSWSQNRLVSGADRIQIPLKWFENCSCAATDRGYPQLRAYLSFSLLSWKPFPVMLLLIVPINFLQ